MEFSISSQNSSPTTQLSGHTHNIHLCIQSWRKQKPYVKFSAHAQSASGRHIQIYSLAFLFVVFECLFRRSIDSQFLLKLEYLFNVLSSQIRFTNLCVQFFIYYVCAHTSLCCASVQSALSYFGGPLDSMLIFRLQMLFTSVLFLSYMSFLRLEQITTKEKTHHSHATI